MTARHSRPNATGRSSGKKTPAALKGAKIDEPFAPLIKSVLNHIVPLNLSKHAYRILFFLLREQVNHAGYENGHLYATYDQLVELGVRRSSIYPALQQLIECGLVERTDFGGYGSTGEYQLTFLPTVDPNTGYYLPPKRKFKGDIAPR